LVTWGRAWRAALAWLGWSIVWGIIGIILVVIGAVIIGGTAANSINGGTNYFAGGAVGGTILIIIGAFVWLLGAVATFFKINSEVVSEEVKRPTPQPVAAQVTTSVCPSCGAPLRYIPQYQKWYCDREGKYV
jgi:hypothetical protein